MSNEANDTAGTALAAFTMMQGIVWHLMKAGLLTGREQAEARLMLARRLEIKGFNRLEDRSELCGCVGDGSAALGRR